MQLELRKLVALAENKASFTRSFAQLLHRVCKDACACGEIGRRARLRIWCSDTCRFESYQAHKKRRESNFSPLFIINISIDYSAKLRTFDFSPAGTSSSGRRGAKMVVSLDSRPSTSMAVDIRFSKKASFSFAH